MPCCPVGARPDLARIDHLLRTKSIRQVASETGLSRPALTKHLVTCLGEEVRNAPVHLSAPQRAAGHANHLATPPGGDATGQASTDSPPNEGPATATTERTPMAVAALYSPRWGHPRTALTEEQRIAFLCDLIENNKFYFRRTLDGLAREWNENGTEVRRLFLVARQKLSADRQSLAVQLEITISALERHERLAMAEWRRLKKSQPSVAKGYLALVRQLRGDIAEFVGLRKIRLEAELNVWTRPEFVAAVDSVTEAHVSVLLPASEQDEQSGLSVVYGKTEEAMGEKLTDRDRRLIGEALAQAAMLVDERIVQIFATGQGKQAGAGEPMAAE